MSLIPAERTPRVAGSPPASRVAARDPERELLLRYQAGDVRAREELVQRLLPLTKRIAGRYRHSGESQEDLEQVACVGLLKAIDRYDPQLGPFVRYAVPSILGELKRHFRDKGWGVRVGRAVQENRLRVNDAVDELSGQLGRSPTMTDIARHTGLEVEDVVEAFEAATAYSPVALDAPQLDRDEEGRTLGESLGAEDPAYRRVELAQALGPAFRALPARDQTIIKLRFIDDLTQSEIARAVGISQMHVSRLLRRSLARLAAAAGGADAIPT